MNVSRRIDIIVVARPLRPEARPRICARHFRAAISRLPKLQWRHALTILAIAFAAVNVHAAPIAPSALQALCNDSPDAAEISAAQRATGTLAADVDDATQDRNAAAVQERGLYQEAEELYWQLLAARLARGAPGAFDASATLGRLATLLLWRSAYPAAKAMIACEISVRERLRGSSDPATALAYAQLGEYEAAVKNWSDARRLLEASLVVLDSPANADKAATAYAMTVLAHLLRSGNPDEQRHALSLYESALRLHLELEECADGCLDAAIDLDNIGEFLMDSALDDSGKARECLERALSMKIRLRGPMHDSTATTLDSLARLAERTDAASALELHRRAVAIDLVAGRTAEGRESFVLSRLADFSANLAMFLETRSKDDGDKEAILYYKISVDARQRMRGGAARLPRGDRAALTKAIGEPYRRLAGLLAGHDRFAEAEATLLSLKEAEFAEFVRGEVEVTSAPLPLSAAELTAIAEFSALAQEAADAQERVDDASRNTTSDLKARMAARDRLQEQLLAKLREVSGLLHRDGNTAPELSQVAPGGTRLGRLVERLEASPQGGSTALVVYVPDKKVTRLWVVAAGRKPEFRLLDKGTAELTPLILQLRDDIHRRERGEDAATKLYSQLVSPVDKILRQWHLKPQTLMLYLNGTLRYLPFAALIDEDRQYLIRNRSLAVVTDIALQAMEARAAPDWTITAFGSALKFPDFNALPAVTGELTDIVREDGEKSGSIPGIRLLNERFSRNAWSVALDSPQDSVVHRGNILHVATHFKSEQSDWPRSFLVLGTGDRYFVSELLDQRSANLSDVELVTLSACSTELPDEGEGLEVEGLGAIFQRMKARAVIGTLWPIEDDGGAALMKEFYRARGEHRLTSKAEALRAAQLRLLDHPMDASGRQIDLSLPFYWAPFILMGNWL